MTIFKIKSAVLREKGEKFETASRPSAERRLAEIRKVDPQARILTIPPQR